MKKKPFAFRISESGYKILKQKSKRGKVTMTEFLERAITDKKIVVVDGVQELLSELKAIGRNLNQLTTLANMGKVDVVYLTDIPILRWSSPPMWTTSTCTPTLLSTRSASKQGRNYTKAPKLCKSFEPTPTKFVSNMG